MAALDRGRKSGCKREACAIRRDVERRARWWVAACVLAVVGMGLGRPLVDGRLASGTLVGHVEPAGDYMAERLAAGQLAEWWSEAGLGEAFFVPGRGVGYPPWVASGFLPSGWSSDLLVVFHLCLFGLGVAACSRRLGAQPLAAAVVGGAVAISGPMVGQGLDGSILFVAWLPWIAWTAERLTKVQRTSDSVLCALSLGCLLAAPAVAGSGATAVVGGLLAVIVWLVQSRDRRIAAWLALALGLPVLLTLHVWLPALLIGVWPGGEASLTSEPWGVLELIWPQLVGDPGRPATDLSRLGHTGGGLFVGMFVLVGAVAAAGRVRWLAVSGLALAVLVLASGLDGWVAGQLGRCPWAQVGRCSRCVWLWCSRVPAVAFLALWRACVCRRPGHGLWAAGFWSGQRSWHCSAVTTWSR